MKHKVDPPNSGYMLLSHYRMGATMANWITTRDGASGIAYRGIGRDGWPVVADEFYSGRLEGDVLAAFTRISKNEWLPKSGTFDDCQKILSHIRDSGASWDLVWFVWFGITPAEDHPPGVFLGFEPYDAYGDSLICSAVRARGGVPDWLRSLNSYGLCPTVPLAEEVVGKYLESMESLELEKPLFGPLYVRIYAVWLLSASDSIPAR